MDDFWGRRKRIVKFMVKKIWAPTLGEKLYVTVDNWVSKKAFEELKACGAVKLFEYRYGSKPEEHVWCWMWSPSRAIPILKKHGYTVENELEALEWEKEMGEVRAT